MAAAIDVYFDFRSPYAYFLSQRLRSETVVRRGHSWRWRPVSIDVLLNLQAGREPWAPYVDPLSGPKRTHLIADVRRLATFYDVKLRAPKPARPNSIPALYLASRLDEQERAAFIPAVFNALWQEQQDISTPELLAACLGRAGARSDGLRAAFEEGARAGLAQETSAAYARGVFGVPTFIFDNEVVFGNDRLDLLLWMIERRLTG
jgi:2-hydroxychromene-2-carboxylate isomerase